MNACTHARTNTHVHARTHVHTHNEVFGSREADARNGFDGLPSHLKLANYNKYADRVQNWDDRKEQKWDQNTEKLWEHNLSWDVHLKWLRTVTRLPIIIKGVLRGDDAGRALSAGASGIVQKFIRHPFKTAKLALLTSNMENRDSGIIVSTHGGRQLDGCLSSFEALPEVVHAVRLGCFKSLQHHTRAY